MAVPLFNHPQSKTAPLCETSSSAVTKRFYAGKHRMATACGGQDCVAPDAFVGGCALIASYPTAGDAGRIDFPLNACTLPFAALMVAGGPMRPPDTKANWETRAQLH